jgi:hypothetical protein
MRRNVNLDFNERKFGL